MFEGDFEETIISLMESKGSSLTNLESGFSTFSVTNQKPIQIIH